MADTANQTWWERAKTSISSILSAWINPGGAATQTSTDFFKSNEFTVVLIFGLVLAVMIVVLIILKKV